VANAKFRTPTPFEFHDRDEHSPLDLTAIETHVARNALFSY
jgi:hypothetical protein